MPWWIRLPPSEGLPGNEGLRLGGNAEVLAALEMAQAHMKNGQILVADRGYGDERFVSGLRGWESARTRGRRRTRR